jgi:nucleotide-binding universal stress UspA family protein
MSAAKILCPIDFSPGSHQAQRVACRVARELSAELVLVHSWYQPASAYPIETPYPAYVVDHLVEESKRKLDAAVTDASTAGVEHVRGELMSGVPWVEIVAQLERHAFDLCVIGTHGRTGIAHILLGSVAEKVVRHAPSPVLVVRPHGNVERFTHALVPTDFSDSATHAADLAAALVRPPGRITLLHVIDRPVAATRELALEQLALEVDKLGAAELAKLAARLANKTSVPITVSTWIGNPGAQTLALIDADPTIDLVVTGSHGRTGIKRVLLGSVAEKLVRHARCAVLVAHTRA